jgi:S-adenosylmethionine:tRNA-ribosyltransferase-isomerase (queuine synthetase)
MMLDDMTYKIRDFDYELPQELIAQTPIDPRDASRLLVVHRDTGIFEHRHFGDIGDYLRPGDLLIANQSRVLPARLLGHREETGGAVEVLLLAERPDLGSDFWETLVRPGRRLREGSRIVFGNEAVDLAEMQQEAYLQAEVLERTDAGGRIVRFTVENGSISTREGRAGAEGTRDKASRAGAEGTRDGSTRTGAEGTRAGASPAPTIYEAGNQLTSYSSGAPLRSPSRIGGDASRMQDAPLRSPSEMGGNATPTDEARADVLNVSVRDLIEQLGRMPLPPYIHETLQDPERYQTVYARIRGSAAAPTAGLHFTPHLLEQLRQQGVRVGFVTLHVGLDTFRPIECEDVRDHKMHSEQIDLDAPTAELINETRRAGGRVVAVGTTAVRVLESVASFYGGHIEPYHGATRLFIMPGYGFQVVDAMITNFHLPRSSLILLVSAFASKTLIEKAYQEAIRERYRFFSFGDAMLML